MNSALITKKFDLYNGDGIQLKEKHNVNYVPRFRILDSKGIVVADISTDSMRTKERMISISKKIY